MVEHNSNFALRYFTCIQLMHTRDGDSASVRCIFYIPQRKRCLGQKPDAAKKCGRLWILIQWNFNLWIFPSFPSESKDKPRDVTSLDLDQWKNLRFLSSAISERSFVRCIVISIFFSVISQFISILLLFSVYFYSVINV